MKSIGKTTWIIPDMFWPKDVAGGNAYGSHEAVCVLNTSDKDCEIGLTLYFEDREPVIGFRAVCPARRTNHIRLDKIKDAEGNPIPRETAYAMVVNCSVPAVVQYTRVDTALPAFALTTTMAY